MRSPPRAGTLPSAYFTPPAGPFAFSSSNPLIPEGGSSTDGGLPSHVECALLLARFVHQRFEPRVAPKVREEAVVPGVEGRAERESPVNCSGEPVQGIVVAPNPGQQSRQEHAVVLIG
jgi:hypothetical protein